MFDKKVSHVAGGPTRVENAKNGVIQFQISPPKTFFGNNSFRPFGRLIHRV